MISTATLRDHLGLEPGEGSDTALERLERGAVAFLQSWIPRYLGPPREHAVVLDGGVRRDGGLIWSGVEQDRLLLPDEIAFEDLVSVQHRSSPSLPWEDLDTGLEAYEVEGRTLYRTTGPWPAGRRNLRVTYLEGFDVDAGPDDVTLAVLDLVKARWDHREANGIKSERADDLAITYADAGKVPGLTQLLDQLKRSRNF